MEIKSKIYYEKINCNILVITAEYIDISTTTKEEDMEIYPELKGKDINEVDFIELEYGTFLETFQNAKSFKINIENKKLEVVYYTQEELDEQRKQNESPIVDYTTLIPEILKSLIQ